MYKLGRDYTSTCTQANLPENNPEKRFCATLIDVNVTSAI